MRRVMSWSLVMLAFGSTATSAQPVQQAQRPVTTQGSAARTPQQVREARYQIGQMERLLEGAVEHGAAVIRDRLQAIMPADMLLTENARARGFRLEGYGLFFDVEVPDLGGTLAWSFRTLDRNNLGLDAALQTLRAYVQASGNDVNLQQALKRVELQVSPVTAMSTVTDGAAAVPASSAAPAPVTAPAPRITDDPVLANPDEAYRTEIKDALMDSMLEHSRSLALGPEEWLTVAARRIDDRTRLGIDTDARTVVLTVKGADLAAFLAGQLTLPEARRRIEVRVF
ncbi:MAG TPA: hypothetical protein VM032_06595 [Vicinamibacterales bacterium]|nr:hypothetical protein [Vicinamibacterales bacterium]